MTPEQLAVIRDRLKQNRQPIARGEQFAHPRGWNDCLDFVERTFREVLGEPEPAKASAAAGGDVAYNMRDYPL